MYHLNDRKAAPLIDCWNWSANFCLPSLFIAVFFHSLIFLSLSKGIIEPPEGTKIYKDSWDFGPYLKILNAAVGDEIFRHSSWIKEYFTWAGFKDYNLVVRVCLWSAICLCFPVLWKYMKTPSYSNLFLNKHFLSPTICLTENRWDNVLKQSLFENVFIGSILRSSSVSLWEDSFSSHHHALVAFVLSIFCGVLVVWWKKLLQLWNWQVVTREVTSCSSRKW